jgi:hypothetical protein
VGARAHAANARENVLDLLLRRVGFHDDHHRGVPFNKFAWKLKREPAKRMNGAFRGGGGGARALRPVLPERPLAAGAGLGA